MYKELAGWAFRALEPRKERKRKNDSNKNVAFHSGKINLVC